MITCKTDPFPLGPVLKDELAEIKAARQARFGTKKQFWKEEHERPSSDQNLAKPEWQIRDIDWITAIQKAHGEHLVGLAFSGGGIRSAAFNLGVLGGLADRDLLRRIDYLSTVSGGGYIGGWLATWAKRRKSIGSVQGCLRKQREKQNEDSEPTPIRFLRTFSNYLTPRIGLFNADTWTMAATYLKEPASEPDPSVRFADFCHAGAACVPDTGSRSWNRSLRYMRCCDRRSRTGDRRTDDHRTATIRKCVETGRAATGCSSEIAPERLQLGPAGLWIKQSH